MVTPAILSPVLCQVGQVPDLPAPACARVFSASAKGPPTLPTGFQPPHEHFRAESARVFPKTKHSAAVLGQILPVLPFRVSAKSQATCARQPPDACWFLDTQRSRDRRERSRLNRTPCFTTSPGIPESTSPPRKPPALESSDPRSSHSTSRSAHLGSARRWRVANRPGRSA